MSVDRYDEADALDRMRDEEFDYDSPFVGLLNDRGIVERNIVSPLRPTTKLQNDRGTVLHSYGLGPCGYDACLSSEFFVQTEHDFEKMIFSNKMLLLPGGAILGATEETFHMPDDIGGEVWGKSSYARQFVHVLCTPLEPGWTGRITLEIVNLGRQAVPLHVGQGICQVRFYTLTGPTSMPYSGKYQNAMTVEKAK